jgi:hypothetical protein
MPKKRINHFRKKKTVVHFSINYLCKKQNENTTKHKHEPETEQANKKRNSTLAARHEKQELHSSEMTRDVCSKTEESYRVKGAVHQGVR